MELQHIYDEINWKELETQMELLFPEWKLSFSDMVSEVASGNGKGFLQVLEDSLKEILLLEWSQLKQITITITIVIFVSAIFTTFKDAFQNHQIAEISFYINYLILIFLIYRLQKTYHSWLLLYLYSN